MEKTKKSYVNVKQVCRYLSYAVMGIIGGALFMLPVVGTVMALAGTVWTLERRGWGFPEAVFPIVLVGVAQVALSFFILSHLGLK